MATTLDKTQVIVKNGEPLAVILDIQKYKRLLELAEDKKDLAELQKIKRSKTSFRRLEDYIKESCIKF